MNVGIFGGTFNPPHKTHILIAKQAKAQLSLDKLIVMPCGIPPHKSTDVDAVTRLRLAKLAFGSFAEVDDFEITKQGKSYTSETLREIKRRYPDSALFLIIGGDSFEQFDTWHCPREIASLCTLAVAARAHNLSPQTVERIGQNTGAKFVTLDVCPNEVSSSEVRLRYQFGLPNSEFVPAEADEFILRNGLYSRFRQVAEKLRSYLTKERFMHTFFVVKRGLELANDNEKDKVFLACLLHDCAKYIPPERYAFYGFEKPSDMPEPVVHSFLGALVAEKDFGICDAEILDAISFHTTGRPAMTRLEKIVYVADKTEQTRPYPLAHLVTGTLDEQFKKCLAEATLHTKSSHGKTSLYPLSEQTLNYYCSEQNQNNHIGENL